MLPVSKADIVAALEASAIAAFGGSALTGYLRPRGGRTVTTKLVKSTFGKLGKDFGFRVCAHQCEEADHGEWLYDLAWVEMEGDYLVRMPVVVESEWKYHYAVADQHRVDHDFQKIVQARSEVGVWVSSVPNHSIAMQHIAECEKQARLFAGSQPGDTYLFIINVWQTGETVIQSFTP